MRWRVDRREKGEEEGEKERSARDRERELRVRKGVTVPEGHERPKPRQPWS